MNEIAKNLMCIQMRSGVEKWVEKHRVDKLLQILPGLTSSAFIEIEDGRGEMVNTADIVGIFTADTMVANTKRKNGDWQCGSLTWHTRAAKCDCPSLEAKKRAQAREDAIKACGRCKNGFIEVHKKMEGRAVNITMSNCACVSGLT